MAIQSTLFVCLAPDKFHVLTPFNTVVVVLTAVARIGVDAVTDSENEGDSLNGVG